MALYYSPSGVLALFCSPITAFHGALKKLVAIVRTAKSRMLSSNVLMRNGVFFQSLSLLRCSIMGFG